MGLHWRHSPEGHKIKEQSDDRRSRPLEDLASGYMTQAKIALSENNGFLRQEIAAPIAEISPERPKKQELEKFVRALRPSVFADIEDENERLAFALALVRAYRESVH